MPRKTQWRSKSKEAKVCWDLTSSFPCCCFSGFHFGQSPACTVGTALSFRPYKRWWVFFTTLHLHSPRVASAHKTPIWFWILPLYCAAASLQRVFQRVRVSHCPAESRALLSAVICDLVVKCGVQSPDNSTQWRLFLSNPSALLRELHVWDCKAASSFVNFLLSLWVHVAITA